MKPFNQKKLNDMPALEEPIEKTSIEKAYEALEETRKEMSEKYKDRSSFREKYFAVFGKGEKNVEARERRSEEAYERMLEKLSKLKI